MLELYNKKRIFTLLGMFKFHDEKLRSVIEPMAAYKDYSHSMKRFRKGYKKERLLGAYFSYLIEDITSMVYYKKYHLIYNTADSLECSLTHLLAEFNCLLVHATDAPYIEPNNANIGNDRSSLKIMQEIYKSLYINNT